MIEGSYRGNRARGWMLLGGRVWRRTVQRESHRVNFSYSSRRRTDQHSNRRSPAEARLGICNGCSGFGGMFGGIYRGRERELPQVQGHLPHPPLGQRHRGRQRGQRLCVSHGQSGLRCRSAGEPVSGHPRLTWSQAPPTALSARLQRKPPLSPRPLPPACLERLAKAAASGSATVMRG